MDLGREGIFRLDPDFDEERFEEKELVVYLVDASPKMFTATSVDEDGEKENHFHVAIDCIEESLKTQIIGRPNDEVAISFFNTKEKKNLQELTGVYVFNVLDREYLDRPTARLIKEVSSIEDSFMSSIGSHCGIIPGSRENSLYNALWVAQALLQKGSAKTTSKRILIFTNEDDPFGGITGPLKTDMMRTTLQRAQDARDVGISIELLPLSTLDDKFNVSILYADIIGQKAEEISCFLSAAEKLEEMKNHLRKQMFKKHKIKTLEFTIANDVSIQVNTYALIHPIMPGKVLWFDSVTNHPLKIGRSFICSDTGAFAEQAQKHFYAYNDIPIKKVSDSQLRLLGFKPLDHLKDYHNLRPSTFIFPTDEEISGSTRIFIALHRSMICLQRFALAFYGSLSQPRLVALVAQDEITSSSGQLEPPGMHMIYLPYSDDIRNAEQYHLVADDAIPRATDDQINKASAVVKRLCLEDFSVRQFTNPALQRHYEVLQALALDEDEIPDIYDETLPDEEGMARRGVVRVLEEFRDAIYGENHDQKEAEFMSSKSSGVDTSRKRKAMN